MISKEEFWLVMDGYGQAIWPVQIIFYVAAILITGWLYFKPGKPHSLITKLFLTLAFAWNGIGFYMTLAKGMAGNSHSNIILGLLFLVVAALWLVDLFRNTMQFVPPKSGWRKNLLLVFTLLVLCYPLLGIALKHPLTSLIMPGIFPCPTVALSLLLLTTALPRVDKFIYITLLFCAIPFTLFYQVARYGVYEDVILFTSGVYCLVLFLQNWKLR
ncbi:MAG: hypothetical protein JW908_16990 [Anaerolineales bacterium]|nr:hypothetical protein [Anaerolineales bacterium]